MGIRRNTSVSRSEPSLCTVISAEELLERVRTAAVLQDPPEVRTSAAPQHLPDIRTAADIGSPSPAFPKRKQAVAQLIRRITVFDDRVEIRLNVGLPTSPLKPLNSINTGSALRR